tara:strand:- start:3325 stop:4368 length:1044 start_codon:yes stop_codon:yes gene_type:complete
MIKEVILHIGSPKAGSSSIQASLKDFDDGETFYASLAEVNHTLPIIVSFLDDKSIISRNTKKVRNAITKKQKHLEKLKDQLSRKDRKRIIISGEGIAHKLNDKEKQKLIECLCSKGANLKIVYYVREPISFTKSIFQQQVKVNGRANLQKSFKSKHKLRLNYFYKIIPKENIIVRKFDRDLLDNGCIVRDFSSAVGIEVDKVVNVNESLSLPALKLLYEFNKTNIASSFDQDILNARWKTVNTIMNCYKDFEPIDKKLFAPFADFSEVEYLNKVTNIKFRKPDLIEESNLDEYLGKTQDIDLNILCRELNNIDGKNYLTKSSSELTTKLFKAFLDNPKKDVSFTSKL